jgi:hypothetical protein
METCSLPLLAATHLPFPLPFHIALLCLLLNGNVQSSPPSLELCFLFLCHALVYLFPTSPSQALPPSLPLQAKYSKAELWTDVVRVGGLDSGSSSKGLLHNVRGEEVLAI